MMRAKKCAAVISALMLTVSAQSVAAKYNVDQNIYNFSYESTVSNPLPLNVICLKPGIAPDDITDDNFSDVIVFADDLTVKPESVSEMEFSIPSGMEEGIYSIWVYTGQYKTPENAYDTFYYPSSAGLSAMLGEFNADSADYAALFEKYTSQDKLMLEKADPNDEYYIANKESVNELIASHRPFASCGDVDNAYVDAMLTDKINNAGSENIEEITDSLFELKGIEATASYTTDKEIVLSAFLDEKEAFTNTDEAMKSFEKITVLTLVNETKENSKMHNIIKDYADYIGIDYDEYVEAGANNVNRYLIDKNFETVDDIKTSVENGIAAKDDDDDDSGSSNRGGGSSSSRGGGSFSVQDTSSNAANSNVQRGFMDMASASWAEAAVNSLAEKGIISGDGNGLFRPDDSVTREEFLKMLMLAFGFKAESGSSSFEDVNSDAWYAPYVTAAYNLGITNGKTDTLFGVGDNITREEMTVFITRAAAALNKSITETSSYNTFSDEGSISDYALDSVKTLQKAGIVQGMENNCFNPSAMSTRAQSAVIIYRALDNIEKGAAQ